ncbi:hypothetical protein V6R21_02790 [Limibacter armeniacum]|uniref:DUF5724 domain-containing protein n=1 Tax=Limibacter armeniacum TaxID=466084 RepID=UPI002FE53668
MEENFLNNRKRENHLEELKAALKAKKEQEGLQLKPNAQRFLQLLVDPKSCGIKGEDRYYGWNLHYYRDDKRTQALKEFFQKDILEQDQLDAMTYVFGKEYATYLHAYWKKIPSFPFNQSHDRRSFRATFTEEDEIKETIFINQCSFLLQAINSYNYDLRIEEFIEHSNAYPVSQFPITALLAGAILSGNTAIEDLLIDIVMGNHDTYKVSAPIIQGLLYSESPRGLEAVKKLLLAAQRQEGLRQTILEAVDQGPLSVFKEFIHLINREQMYRFASVVRAFDVWTGLDISAEKQSMIKQGFLLAEHFLEEPEQIAEGIQSKDNLEAYMALWACATENTGLELAAHLKHLAADPKAIKRLLALRIANELKVNSYYYLTSKDNLEDENETVRFYALKAFNVHHAEADDIQKDRFVNSCIEMVQRVPREGIMLQTKLFAWEERKVQADELVRSIINVLDLGDPEDCERIYPVYQQVDSDARYSIVNAILPFGVYYDPLKSDQIKREVLPHQRDFAFRFLQDKSMTLRESALKVLIAANVDFEELPVFIELLKGKSKGIKKLIHHFFFVVNPSFLLSTIKTLLAQKNAEQRLVGLDYLVALKGTDQFQGPIEGQVGIEEPKGTTYLQWVEATTNDFVVNRPKLTKTEQDAVTLLQSEANKMAEATYENGYGGIYDPTKVLLTNYPKDRRQVLEEIIAKYRIPLMTDSNTKYGYTQSIAKINAALADLAKRFEANAGYEYEV